MTELDRTLFATPRAAEFLERRALQAQTGQPAARFADVVVKELVDNALDAAESAGPHPEIVLDVETGGDPLHVTVADNGPGIPAAAVEQILDFDVLVSDKSAYRSPTRGLQGNAWKTLLGIAQLDTAEPVVIEAAGVRHEVAVRVDPGGNVAVAHEQADSPVSGTRVTIPLSAGLALDAARWARAFAVVNPHAGLSWQANSGDAEESGFYKPTAPEGWTKPLPTDATSPHWYDEPALTKLVFAHVAATRQGAPDLPIGEFVRQFKGLSSTGKAKRVTAGLDGVAALSEFEQRPDEIGVLLAAMRAEARAPKPHALGHVPEEHYRACLDSWYGAERFWFKRKRTVDAAGIPWVFEVAVAATEQPGEVFYAANYSPTFADPLAQTFLAGSEISTTGAASFLRQCDAYPDAGNEYRRAAVVHVICPALEFVDKGKTVLGVPDGRR